MVSDTKQIIIILFLNLILHKLDEGNLGAANYHWSKVCIHIFLRIEYPALVGPFVSNPQLRANFAPLQGKEAINTFSKTLLAKV